MFPISDVFRRSLDVSIIDYIYENKISEGFIFSPNYDSFQQITNAIIFVDINGYSYGGRLLSALLFGFQDQYLSLSIIVVEKIWLYLLDMIIQICQHHFGLKCI